MDNQLSTGALAVIAAAGGVGALLAGLVAAFVNWQTDNRRAEREHQTWLREQKYAAYSEFIASARVMDAHLSTKGSTTAINMGEVTLTFNRRYYDVLMLIDGDRMESFQKERTRFGSSGEDDSDRGTNQDALRNIITLLRDDLLATTTAKKGR